jgi:hypothetical protein
MNRRIATEGLVGCGNGKQNEKRNRNNGWKGKTLRV